MASRSLAPTSRTRPALPSLMDPFRLFQRMDGLLADVVRAAAPESTGEVLATPRMNVEENDREIRVSVELPGVSESDVQITVDDDMLVVSGEKREERQVAEGDMCLVERSFGRFRRAIQLPFAPDPDQVDARFRDGVLTITVPKNAEQRSKTRQIQVKRDDGQAASQSRSAIGGSSQSGGDTGNAQKPGAARTESEDGEGAERRREKAEAPAA